MATTRTAKQGCKGRQGHSYIFGANGKEGVFCQYHCPHDGVKFEEPQYDENYNPIPGASRWGICQDCNVEQEW